MFRSSTTSLGGVYYVLEISISARNRVARSSGGSRISIPKVLPEVWAPELHQCTGYN